MNYKKKILPLVLATILTGCGTKEEDDVQRPEPINNPPSLSVSQSSIEVDENSSVTIDFSVSDPEDQELSFSLSLSENIGEAVIDGNSIVYTAPDNLTEDTNLSITLTVSDGENVVSENLDFLIRNSIGETPIIEIITASPLEVEEGEEEVIEFTISDSDTPLENLQVSYSLSQNVDAQFDMNMSQNTIRISNLNVQEDILVTLNLEVTDGVNSGSDSLDLQLRDTITSELIPLNNVYTDIKNKFESVKNVTNEVFLFDFYQDVATYMNPNALNELLTMRQQISDALVIERDAIQPRVDAIDAYLADENRDLSEVDSFIAMAEDIAPLINNFGSTAVELLNESAEIIGAGLPEISTSVQINSFEFDGQIYYSRYVGSNVFGSLSSSGFTFYDGFKFMETINFLNAQCQTGD